jgi:hypothetical protein
MMEEWRQLWLRGEAWPYAISDHGRVMRTAKTGNGRGTRVGRLVAVVPQRNHYPKVTLWRGNSRRLVTLHRCLMESFVGPPPEGAEVNHKDGNKNNWRLSNLEYVTRKENAQHAIRTGLSVPVCGERHPHAKLTVEQVREIRRRRLAGESLNAIARAYGIANSGVVRIASGKLWASVAV